MQKLSPTWAIFARIQRAADHHQINHRYWATDDAAEAVIDLITGPAKTSPPHLASKTDVLKGNRAAKHRRRRAVLANLVLTDDPIILPPPYAATDARLELDRIRSQVSEPDWQILEMTAMGESQADIAAALGLAEGTVKNRLSQLRRNLLH